MITKIDKILNELSFRVSDGMPNLTNEQHLSTYMVELQKKL